MGSNEDLAFTIVDTSGNTLHFDQFAYERSLEAARWDYHDANWLRCRITLQARIEPFNKETTFMQSVNASVLTTDLTALSAALKVVLISPLGTKSTFEPMEPYVELQIEREEKTIRVATRLDLAPAIGPVIEFDYECRPEEIDATISAIDRVSEVFHERK